ncbi:MAG: hypothetical protein CSA36_07630 [Draconibacterium sp.]|nr:MAG: hypothetical protein CSA36_07630 [Draconibacterium sp.]
MKKLIVLLALVLTASFVFATGSVQDKKSTRKEKRKAEQQRQYVLTKRMLEDRNFVLETNFLDNRYGDRFNVSPTINFIKIDNNQAVIQIGSDHGMGANGVGGVTAKGNITKWDVKENPKSQTFQASILVSTPIGIYDLNFNICPNGLTSARLTGNYSGSLTFNGRLIPVDESIVYEGWSL